MDSKQRRVSCVVSVLLANWLVGCRNDSRPGTSLAPVVSSSIVSSSVAASADSPVVNTTLVDTTLVDTTLAEITSASSTVASVQSTAPTELKTSTSSSSSQLVREGIAKIGAASANAKCTAPTTPVRPEGEVTFVQDGRVWAVGSGDTSPRCLYDLKGRLINQIKWSPDSKAVLLGADMVARGPSIRPSGYLPTNKDVNWSGPKGTSLLATTAKGELIKRDSTTGVRTDISFLNEQTASTYHPAGKAIFSIGSSADTGGENVDGNEINGVWIADNLGGNAKLLIEDVSAAKLSDLVVTGTGERVHFIAEHSDGFHLHQYDLFGNDQDKQLSVAFDSPDPLHSVTVSAVDNSVAVQVGTCGEAKVLPDVFYRADTGSFRSLRAEVPQIGLGELAPVGWLPGHRLVVTSRLSSNASCFGGIDESFIVNVNTHKVVSLGAGLKVIGIRSPHAIAKDLVISIDLEVEA
jgi:dipeptidyl aminopeptidase/acylaminoacyl peptidase